MENSRIDLHLHTTASDGTFSPVEVVTKALEIGLKVISITDHDTVNGITEAIRYIDELRQTNIYSAHLSSVSQKESPAVRDANIHPFPLEIIPGVELSSTFKHKEVHILGYFIDYKDSKLLEQLENLRKFRIERGRKIASKLAGVGIIIDFQDILRRVGNGSVGRLHFANALVEGKYVYSVEYAMQKYLSKGKVGYVPHNFLTPEECIKVIKDAKGIAVMAHPGLYDKDGFIPHFVKFGIDGIEVYHTSHSFEDTKRYINIAQKYNLLITGGSDCHGLAKGNALIGLVDVPYELVEELKKRAL